MAGSQIHGDSSGDAEMLDTSSPDASGSNEMTRPKPTIGEEDCCTTVLTKVLGRVLSNLDLESAYRITRTCRTLQQETYEIVTTSTASELSHLNVLFSLILFGSGPQPPQPNAKPRRTPAEITLTAGMSHRVPSVVRRLPGLSKLVLLLGRGPVPDHVCLDIARALRATSLQSLTHLRLEFSCASLSERGYAVVAAAVAEMQGVQDFCWNMSESNVSLPTLQICCTAVAKIPKLQRLELDVGYPDSPLDLGGAHIIGAALKELRPLTRIDLCLGGSSLTPLGANIVVKHLLEHQMGELEELSLELSQLGISGDDLGFMADALWYDDHSKLNTLRMRSGFSRDGSVLRRRDQAPPLPVELPLPPLDSEAARTASDQSRPSARQHCFVQVAGVSAEDSGLVRTEPCDVRQQQWRLAADPPNRPWPTARHNLDQGKLPLPPGCEAGDVFCPSDADDSLLAVQVGSHVVLRGLPSEVAADMILWQRPLPKEKRVPAPVVKMRLGVFNRRRGWVHRVELDATGELKVFVYVSMQDLVYEVPVNAWNLLLVTPTYRAWTLAGLNANCWKLHFYCHDLTPFRTNLENDSLVEPVLLKSALTQELLQHLSWASHEERKAKFRRCFWAIGGDLVPTSGKGPDHLTQEDVCNAKLLQLVEDQVARATGRTAEKGYRTSCFYLQDRDTSSPEKDTDAMPVYNVHIDADPTDQSALSRFLAAGDVMFVLRWWPDFFHCEMQITFIKFFYACKCMAPSAVPESEAWEPFLKGASLLEEFSSKCNVINWWSLLELEGSNHQLHFFPGHLLKLDTLAEYWAGFAGSARYLPPNFAPTAHRAGMRLNLERGDAMVFDATITPHGAGIIEAERFAENDEVAKQLQQKNSRKSLDFRVLQCRDEDADEFVAELKKLMWPIKKSLRDWRFLVEVRSWCAANLLCSQAPDANKSLERLSGFVTNLLGKMPVNNHGKKMNGNDNIELVLGASFRANKKV